MSASSQDVQDEAQTPRALVARHLRAGWLSLLAFMVLGLVLEALHGFKIGWYLDADHETRRLMFRLAHAHGTLLSLVHVALAATLHARLPGMSEGASIGAWQTPSRALLAAGVLLPAGFALGGLGARGGDPGLGIALAPLGAGLAILSVAQVVRLLGRD